MLGKVKSPNVVGGKRGRRDSAADPSNEDGKEDAEDAIRPRAADVIATKRCGRGDYSIIARSGSLPAGRCRSINLLAVPTTQIA